LRIDRFKKFLIEAEVAQSKRVGIEHISKLKPLEFINLCEYFRDDLKGIISQERVKINLKIDGCGVRFGVDTKGNFFLESSKSGPQFEEGAFSGYTKNKFGSSNPVSDSYDDVFKTLKNYKPLQKYLQSFEKGVKIFCELLYTPLAKEIEGQLQFLVIKYDKGMLGQRFSLIFFKAEDLEGNSIDENEVATKLKTLTTPDIVFDDQRIKYHDIDISYEVNNFFEMISDFEDVKTVLASRLGKDKETKKALGEIIQRAQYDISKKIIATKFNHRFSSSEFEGLVIYFTNGKVVKVVTDTYKGGKEEFNATYKGAGL
jgi:hypothetical protein